MIRRGRVKLNFTFLNSVKFYIGSVQCQFFTNCRTTCSRLENMLCRVIASSRESSSVTSCQISLSRSLPLLSKKKMNKDDIQKSASCLHTAAGHPNQQIGSRPKTSFFSGAQDAHPVRSFPWYGGKRLLG